MICNSSEGNFEMRTYEVYSIGFSKDAEAAHAYLKEKFTTIDSLQAMKCYVRDNLGMAFYYEGWKEKHQTYVFKDLVFCVVPNDWLEHNKTNLFVDAYNLFIKKKKEKPCDCGAFAVKTTHSHWCSTQEK
jgi:hypothetical protein